MRSHRDLVARYEARLSQAAKHRDEAESCLGQVRMRLAHANDLAVRGLVPEADFEAGLAEAHAERANDEADKAQELIPNGSDACDASAFAEQARDGARQARNWVLYAAQTARRGALAG